MSKVIEHRRGQPRARYSRTDTDGTLVKLRADRDGVVAVHDEAEQRIADAIGLRVTRVPKAEPKRKAAPAEPTPPEPEA